MAIRQPPIRGCMRCTNRTLTSPGITLYEWEFDCVSPNQVDEFQVSEL